MAHYDRVEQFMDGIGFTAYSTEIKRRVITKRSRNLAIPIGRESLWAVLNRATLESSTVKQVDTCRVTVEDSFKQTLSRRGKVIEDWHTLTSSLGGIPLKLAPDNIPESFTPSFLAVRFQGYSGNEHSLTQGFSFDKQGMLSLYGYRSADYPYERYVGEYETFMDTLTTLRDSASRAIE